MADKFFRGDAMPVAKVYTVKVTADDVATTYTVTINNKTVSTLGQGSAAATAAAWQSALASSTLPEFLEADWTVSGDTVTAAAHDPGTDYVITAGVAGGTGTVLQTLVTPSSGPAHW